MSIGSRFLVLVLGVLCAFSMAQMQPNRASPFNAPAAPPQPPQNNGWNFRALFNRMTSRASSDSSAGASGNVCEWKDPESGVTFDFSKLKQNKDDIVGQDGSYKYYMNFCGSANIGGLCTLKSSAICQYSKLTNNYISSLGSWSGVPAPVYSAIDKDIKKGVQISLHNGDICWMSGRQVPRSVNIQLQCASKQDETMEVQELIGQCTHNIVFHTPLACAASSAGSGFTSFLVFLLVTAALYVGVGCFYNVKVNGMSWGKLETIPQYSFWKEVPTYVKDGAVWVYRKVDSIRTGNDVAYQRVATDDHDDDDGEDGTSKQKDTKDTYDL